MQIQSDGQALLARHLAIKLNLFFKGGGSGHDSFIVRFAASCNFLISQRRPVISLSRLRPAARSGSLSFL
jgi:hypothetical protein